MNVILMRKEQRERDLELIREVINKLMLQDKLINRKELIAHIMIQVKLSKRTSQEYLDAILITEHLGFANGKIKVNENNLSLE